MPERSGSRQLGREVFIPPASRPFLRGELMLDFIAYWVVVGGILLLAGHVIAGSLL